MLFCLISSAVYIINDLVDMPKDRLHPEKRNRPLASGALNPTVAMVAAVIIVVGCLPVALAVSWQLAAILYGYLLLMILYTFWLKNIVIIDVLTIAAGLCAAGGSGRGGGQAARFSPWLYVCMTLLALFLGLGKRRQEIVLLNENGASTRRILAEYNLRFIDEMLALVSASTVMAYATYTFSAPNLPANHLMMLTIPFVLYAIFRYLYLIHVKGETDPPDVVVFKDRPLQLRLALVRAGRVRHLLRGIAAPVRRLVRKPSNQKARGIRPGHFIIRDFLGLRLGLFLRLPRRPPLRRVPDRFGHGARRLGLLGLRLGRAARASARAAASEPFDAGCTATGSGASTASGCSAGCFFARERRGFGVAGASAAGPSAAGSGAATMASTMVAASWTAPPAPASACAFAGRASSARARLATGSGADHRLRLCAGRSGSGSAESSASPSGAASAGLPRPRPRPPRRPRRDFALTGASSAGRSPFSAGARMSSGSSASISSSSGSSEITTLGADASGSPSGRSSPSRNWAHGPVMPSAVTP